MASLGTQETRTMRAIEGPITIPAHASAPACVRLMKRYNMETKTEEEEEGRVRERERVGLDETKGKKWCK